MLTPIPRAATDQITRAPSTRWPRQDPTSSTSATSIGRIELQIIVQPRQIDPVNSTVLSGSMPASFQLGDFLENGVGNPWTRLQFQRFFGCAGSMADDRACRRTSVPCRVWLAAILGHNVGLGLIFQPRPDDGFLQNRPLLTMEGNPTTSSVDPL